MDCNNILFPDPLGPKIILLIGSLGAMAYLLCFTIYSLTSTGFIIGVDIFLFPYKLKYKI